MERYAVATGNWSATSTWDGLTTLPGASDDVHANGFTVTIDQDVTVLSVRTTAGGTAAAGGGFTLTDGWTLTADCRAGSTNCVTFSAASPAESWIVGDLVGSTTGTSAAAICSSTGTLNVTGDVTGGNSNGRRGATNNSTGTLNIVGVVTGGTSSLAYGVFNNSTGTVNITGGVIGGSDANVYGVNNNSGTINVTGDITGGSNTTAWGAHNSSSGTINVTGDLIPAAASAVYSASTGRIYVNGNLQSVSTGRAAYGGGIFVIHETNTVTHAYRDWDGASVGAERVLSTAGGGTQLVVGTLGARSIGTY